MLRQGQAQYPAQCPELAQQPEQHQVQYRTQLPALFPVQAQQPAQAFPCPVQAEQWIRGLHPGMHRLSIICRMSKFDELKQALNELGVTGMTMTQVMGCGIQKGSSERYRGAVVDSTLLPKVKVEVVVSKIPVESVIETAKKALYTGHIGDGKIFVYEVEKVVKIRTGEEDFAALQDVE